MNRYFLRFLFTIQTLFFAEVAFPQSNTEFFSVNYSLLPRTDFDEGTGEVQLKHFDLNFVTPTIKLGNKTKINNIVYYRFSEYDYPEIGFPDDFHEIKYSLLARHSFNAPWELLLLPRISVRSDFKANLSHNDLFPAVSAVAMKTSLKNPNFKWGFGLNYNNDLAKNSVVPILAFAYNNAKLRLNAYLPNNAHLIFLSGKKLEYGLGFTTDPIIIHINKTEPIHYLRTLNVPVNALFSYNFTSNAWLNCKAGWMLRRDFDLYNSDFETPSDDFENKIKSNAFFQIGLSLRTK